MRITRTRTHALAAAFLIAAGVTPPAMAEAEPGKPADAKPADEKDKAELYPTGLTIIVKDKDRKVLDTVKVPDDGKHYEITFQVSDALENIRVFALGARTDKSIPAGLMVTGVSKKEGGTGKVTVTVDAGLLTGISGNGFATYRLDDEVRKEIVADLKEDKRAEITTMEEMVEEE